MKYFLSVPDDNSTSPEMYFYATGSINANLQQPFSYLHYKIQWKSTLGCSKWSKIPKIFQRSPWDQGNSYITFKIVWYTHIIWLHTRTRSCHACNGPLPQVHWLIDSFINLDCSGFFSPRKIFKNLKIFSDIDLI